MITDELKEIISRKEKRASPIFFAKAKNFISATDPRVNPYIKAVCSNNVIRNYQSYIGGFFQYLDEQSLLAEFESNNFASNMELLKHWIISSEKPRIRFNKQYEYIRGGQRYYKWFGNEYQVPNDAPERLSEYDVYDKSMHCWIRNTEPPTTLAKIIK